MKNLNRLSILDIDGLRTAAKRISNLCNVLDPVNGTYSDEDMYELRHELLCINQEYQKYFYKINTHFMKELGLTTNLS